VYVTIELNILDFLKPNMIILLKSDKCLEEGRKSAGSHLFILLQDMINVVESRPAKRYGDYFLRQIVKVCQFYCC
jgi:hypothetical protein